MSLFLIFEVIFPQFVMIVPLYLVFINIVLMSLEYKNLYIAPTKYLQVQEHLTSVLVAFAKST